LHLDWTSAMPTLIAEDKRSITDLVGLRRSGYTLPGEFYLSELVYRTEIERVWRRGWLFVCHTCEIRNPGDYATFNVDDDSLIVIRDDDGQNIALWNVCRHRGTQVCGESHGTAGRLVCPYHQWAYARDGALVSCRGMQEDIDKSDLGLLHAQVREVAGLIYVSLSDDPPNFDEAAEAIGQIARPQGLDRAKVAKIVDYDVPANWKLVWENNCECYHCSVNHPQYIKANFDHFNADDLSERVQSQVEGCDYRLEEIMPFWQLTSEQDWTLCELAQKGVNSSHDVPGPFSTYKEYNVDAFVRWCLQQLVIE
jgi:Rieske 2Fe-2S family protein